jgi:peptide deformylase
MNVSIPESNVSVVFRTLLKMPDEIRWFGDPVLRQVAAPFADDELTGFEARDLASRLTDVLSRIRSDTGLGSAIAAPQIGVSRRMFVTFNAAEDRFDAYANPRIVAASAEQGRYNEMCLSGMPLSATVIRPWAIELEFVDANGELQRVAADPILSRVAQHEFDHLDGILFFDRADPATFSFEFDWATLRDRNKLSRVRPDAD